MAQSQTAALAAQPYANSNAYCHQGIFWIKPYVQLGPTRAKDDFELNWFTCIGKQHWQVEFRSLESQDWHPVPVAKAAGHKFYGLDIKHLTANLPLVSSTQLEYRILCNRCLVFSSHLKMPSGKMVIFGDFADGEAPCRQTSWAVNQIDPSLVVIAGDVTYEYGCVCEYKEKLFAAANCDAPGSAATGAPLLCSRTSAFAIGNHDIGAPKEDVDLPRGDVGIPYGFFVFSRNPDNARLPDKITRQMIEQHRKGRSLKRHCGAGFLRLTNYTFSWQDTFWVVLDGNKYLDWSEKALRNWLLSVLESSDATWKFVTFHQPGFSDDVKYGRDQRMRMIADVLEKGGVDIVFSGHCHFYQRHRPLQFTPLTKRPLPDGTVTGTMTIDREFDGVTMTSPRGVIYIISGASGKLVTDRPPEKLSESSCKLIDNIHSFTSLDVQGKTLTVSQIASDDGRELDRFVIEKK